jgi:hypothetical protein
MLFERTLLWYERLAAHRVDSQTSTCAHPGSVDNAHLPSTRYVMLFLASACVLLVRIRKYHTQAGTETRRGHGERDMIVLIVIRFDLLYYTTSTRPTGRRLFVRLSRTKPLPIQKKIPTQGYAHYPERHIMQPLQ